MSTHKSYLTGKNFRFYYNQSNGDLKRFLHMVQKKLFLLMPDSPIDQNTRNAYNVRQMRDGLATICFVDQFGFDHRDFPLEQRELLDLFENPEYDFSKATSARMSKRKDPKNPRDRNHNPHNPDDSNQGLSYD